WRGCEPRRKRGDCPRSASAASCALTQTCFERRSPSALNKRGCPVRHNPSRESAPEPASRWGAKNESDGIRPLAVRPPDAAWILGVGERTLWQWTKEGRIRCLKAGGVKLYRLSDLEAFLDGLAEDGGS